MAKNKNEIEAKIEYQYIIGEVNAGGYRPIRFSRIKYKASPVTHIDIRRYQRGYDSEGEEAFYPTKIGFRFLEDHFRRVVREYVLVPEAYIHPVIGKSSLCLLESGDFESAVLKAFKTVETGIRRWTESSADEFGVNLIRRAFHPENGPLTDLALPKAEREALCHYVAGAFGYYRNPCSHRDIDMDFLSAFARVVVASDLLKIVERAGGAATRKTKA
ncbi:MAG TPA: TIGR02391 family protein [Dissulfurispiraceae bacterium]|nr:TIGR02391 family protein [Dissulfurispiraceae bacterium]